MARLAINKINLYSNQCDVVAPGKESNNFYLQSVSLESDGTYDVPDQLGLNEDTIFNAGSSID